MSCMFRILFMLVFASCAVDPREPILVECLHPTQPVVNVTEHRPGYVELTAEEWNTTVVYILQLEMAWHARCLCPQ